MNKLSIRLRISIMSMVLLTICCVGLTVLLNISAGRSIRKITTSEAYPAYAAGQEATKLSETQNMLALPIENATSDFRVESIIYMSFMILGGGLVAYYISGRALKPLKKLNSQIKNMEIQNLSESLPVPSTQDEIAELTESFNNMTDKLDAAFQVQQQFSANAAHELKTPLAILQTKLDVFQMTGGHTEQEYQELLSVFKQQISRLRELTGDLLDIAQADYTIAKCEVCVQDVVTSVFEELSVLAQQKNVTLLASCGEEIIYADPDSMYRVFYNLIENAIKYNIEGGQVKVYAQQDRTHNVVICIEDTGIGIPDECKADIFTPFFRVDKSRSRQMGGAGLGLALVQKTIQRNGGTIHVSDTGRRGTCFTVTFPDNYNI